MDNNYRDEIQTRSSLKLTPLATNPQDKKKIYRNKCMGNLFQKHTGLKGLICLIFLNDILNKLEMKVSCICPHTIFEMLFFPLCRFKLSSGRYHFSSACSIAWSFFWLWTANWILSVLFFLVISLLDIYSECKILNWLFLSFQHVKM